MSEVTKRDAQGKSNAKLLAYSIKLNKDSIHGRVLVHSRELLNAWSRYQLLHDAVLDRAGKDKLDEQHMFHDGVYDSFLDASSNFSVWLEANDPNHCKPVDNTPTTSLHETIARIILDLERCTI